MRSSARTVTRSPLPTDSAVRSASRPNAVTFTQRVTPSPPGTAGGKVEGQAQLDAGGAVPGGELAGVVAEAAGDGDGDRVHELPPWCGDREGRPPWWRPGDCGALPGGQVPAPRRRGPQPAGPGGQDVSQRARTKSAPAKPAPGRPAAGKDLWPPGASAARGRLREPTQRRKLTKPGRDKPQSRRHPSRTSTRCVPGEKLMNLPLSPGGGTRRPGPRSRRPGCVPADRAGQPVAAQA